MNEGRKWSCVNTLPKSTLSHDIINKLFAIMAHCDELELRIPSPWCFERTAKIKALAQDISDMLRSPECTEGYDDPHAAR